MLKIAVCDDVKKQTAFLEQTLADIFAGLGLEHKTDVFLSADNLCRALESGERYHLIFLDIEFPESEVNGIQAGHFIRNTLRDNDTSIVFISRIKSHSLVLHKIHPLEFLIRPLTREKIEEAVQLYFEIPKLNGGLVWRLRADCYSLRLLCGHS